MSKDYRKSIRRNLKRKIQSPAPKASNEQALILAGLNVMQVLEDNAAQYLQSYLHYGPDSFIAENRAAILVWYRKKGYQHYTEMTLYGVWVIGEEQQNRIIIGTKPLTYTAAVFNAESYNTVIKQTFKPYYEDDISPPDESRILYQTTFDVTRRLALRRELADKLVHWLRHKWL